MHDSTPVALQIERDEYLRTFQSYTNRFRHSYEASYSTNPLYYSTNIGRKPCSLHNKLHATQLCIPIHPVMQAVEESRECCYCRPSL